MEPPEGFAGLAGTKDQAAMAPVSLLPTLAAGTGLALPSLWTASNDQTVYHVTVEERQPV